MTTIFWLNDLSLILSELLINHIYLLGNLDSTQTLHILSTVHEKILSSCKLSAKNTINHVNNIAVSSQTSHRYTGKDFF